MLRVHTTRRLNASSSSHHQHPHQGVLVRVADRIAEKAMPAQEQLRTSIGVYRGTNMTAVSEEERRAPVGSRSASKLLQEWVMLAHNRPVRAHNSDAVDFNIRSKNWTTQESTLISYTLQLRQWEPSKLGRTSFQQQTPPAQQDDNRNYSLKTEDKSNIKKSRVTMKSQQQHQSEAELLRPVAVAAAGGAAASSPTTSSSSASSSQQQSSDDASSSRLKPRVVVRSKQQTSTSSSSATDSATSVPQQEGEITTQREEEEEEQHHSAENVQHHQEDEQQVEVTTTTPRRKVVRVGLATR